MKFGDRVQTKRERLHLSRAELAEQLGVSRHTIWSWETGRGPGGEMAGKNHDKHSNLARALTWLMEDLDLTEDQWKERALAAEYTLAQMTRTLVTYRKLRNGED